MFIIGICTSVCVWLFGCCLFSLCGVDLVVWFCWVLLVAFGLLCFNSVVLFNFYSLILYLFVNCLFCNFCFICWWFVWCLILFCLFCWCFVLCGVYLVCCLVLFDWLCFAVWIVVWLWLLRLFYGLFALRMILDFVL